MINRDGLGSFFTTGIPSPIFYTSLSVMVFALLVVLGCRQIENKKRGLLGVLLLEYLFVVLCSTVICREKISFIFEKVEIIPFWTYKAVLNQVYGVSVWDIILNVVLFVPLGLLVKLLYPKLNLWKMMFIAISCSMFIETNQYFFEKGIAQIDDVMHNVIGAMIGWLISSVLLKYVGYNDGSSTN